MKGTNFSQAFTLAELLTAVLVISVIMVALAPVITKRVKENISVQTDRKKGEEIWTNPGAYTFQVPAGVNILEISGSGGGGGGAGAAMKNYSKTYNGASTRTIIVPKGVSTVTFTLLGAGGGGGGANAKTPTDNCEFSSTNVAIAATDTGRDLCISNVQYANDYAAWVSFTEVGKTNNFIKSCWYGYTSSHPSGTGGGTCTETSWPARTTLSKLGFTGGGCKKMVCNKDGAEQFCKELGNGGVPWSLHNGKSYRQLTVNEFKRLAAQSNVSNNYKWIFGDGLDLGMHRYGADVGNKYTWASEIGSKCVSPTSTHCDPCNLNLSDGWISIRDNDFVAGGVEAIRYFPDGPRDAAQVRCVRELDNWVPYSGAGGAGGAKLIKTINVQPGDTLTFVIGAGGLGGSKGGGTGSQGGATCVEHKRNGVRYTDPDNSLNNGYYCAYGGYGGRGATTSANGQPNATLAACTHADGCTKSINGSAGTSSTGGTGANGGTGATVDTGEDNIVGVGYNGENTASGGGGGFCQRGNRVPSNCQKGGNGVDGSFTIAFDQYVAGGGGGAAGAAGTDSDGNYKPIKLRVQGGETITFTIGSGGLGGQFSTNGEDGGDTVIATKNNPEVFVFQGGTGGKTGVFDGSCTYDNIGCAKGGEGGYGGKYPNYLLTPNSFTYLTPTIESAGKSGGADQMGFQGGSGGTTVLGKYGSCGGFEINVDTTCSKYDADGNSGEKHNPITNLFGGSGGGGAGVDGKNGGSGGSGGPGYIRIKWDEANNE